jgi:hypothetical protein
MAKKINFKNKDEDYTIDDTKYTFNNNQSFCKWLLSKKHKNYIGIAHNLKGNLIIFQNLFNTSNLIIIFFFNLEVMTDLLLCSIY